jgi:poly-gamma-glutamate synthesis protein (capsule biosynthesis protein)
LYTKWTNNVKSSGAGLNLALMYFTSVDPATGKLVRLQMIPTQTRRFRANLASETDARWLQETLNRTGKTFDSRVELLKDNSLSLQ